MAVGLSIVYGVSGVAVNHKADWNPFYIGVRLPGLYWVYYYYR